MTERGDLICIKNEGPRWAGAILSAAEEYINDPALSELSLPARAWRAGAIMVRSGLLLCERRQPGLYHDFLISAGLSVCFEHDLFKETADDLLGVPKVPWHLCGADAPPMAAAEEILKSHAKDPRVVAFALIREGLRVCLLYAPERYQNFAMNVCSLIVEEMQRTEDSPSRLLPKNHPWRHWHLQTLPWTFNLRAAGLLAET